MIEDFNKEVINYLIKYGYITISLNVFSQTPG
jgi:hypothetical protein